MKYFKHMINASNDERMSFVIERTGMEGYGFYWLIMEIIAAQNKNDLQVSISTLSRLSGMTKRKCTKYLDVFAQEGVLYID